MELFRRNGWRANPRVLRQIRRSTYPFIFPQATSECMGILYHVGEGSARICRLQFDSQVSQPRVAWHSEPPGRGDPSLVTGRTHCPIVCSGVPKAKPPPSSRCSRQRGAGADVAWLACCVGWLSSPYCRSRLRRCHIYLRDTRHRLAPKSLRF